MKIAEHFLSVQGEGLRTGHPTYFFRTVGCSVGKKICQHCDTDFERMNGWLGGGEYTLPDLLNFTYESGVRAVCFTGGEPLDDPELPEAISYFLDRGFVVQVETSGTRRLDVLPHGTHITVCPKPGYFEDQLYKATEIKVIVNGLGEMTDALRHGLQQTNPEYLESGRVWSWPSYGQAIEWSQIYPHVFLQPRNDKHTVNRMNLRHAEFLVSKAPTLKLSVQMHKLLEVR